MSIFGIPIIEKPWLTVEVPTGETRERAFPDWRQRFARNCQRALVSNYRVTERLWYTEQVTETRPDPNVYMVEGRMFGHPKIIAVLRDLGQTRLEEPR